MPRGEQRSCAARLPPRRLEQQLPRTAPAAASPMLVTRAMRDGSAFARLLLACRSKVGIRCCAQIRRDAKLLLRGDRGRAASSLADAPEAWRELPVYRLARSDEQGEPLAAVRLRVWRMAFDSASASYTLQPVGPAEERGRW